MQSRDVRFWLLFESGPRDGERVPLAGGVCTLGRSESNSIVLVHGSVSGKHAEFRSEGGNVILRDTGSKNGTRVDDQRIDERRLGHGDLLRFGAVRARFHDAEFAADGGAEGLETSGAAGAESLETVSATVLAHSKSRSKAGILLLLVVIGGLGFLGWRTFGSKEAREQREQVVPSVAGNLLANPSFEEAFDGPWDPAEAASQAFFTDSGFARSGGLGLGVALGKGEWALARSATLRLPAKRTVELCAHLRVTGHALARIGLELSTQDESEPSIHAWAPALSAGDYTASTLVFPMPSGYFRGAVLVAAQGLEGGEGEVALDDVSVVAGEGAGARTVTFEEYTLTVLGAGGSTAILSRSGRVLFTGISLSRWDASGLAGWARGGWGARATANGFALDLDGTPPPETRCELVSFRSRPLSPDSSSPPWIATLGNSGYRSHPLTFERKEATDLLLGGGANMLRLRAGGPDLGADSESIGAATTIRGYASGEDAVLALSMGSAATLEIQLSFDAERATAERIALEARSAAASGEFGAAMSAWGELLDRWAFDAALIHEGETVRAALLSTGHERFLALEGAVDEADFFRLRDAYQRCMDGVRELAVDFAGTELQAKARDLEERILFAMDSLEADHASGDLQRLQGVLSALKGSEDSSLFAHVRAALEAQAGEGPPAE